MSHSNHFSLPAELELAGATELEVASSDVELRPVGVRGFAEAQPIAQLFAAPREAVDSLSPFDELELWMPDGGTGQLFVHGPYPVVAAAGASAVPDEDALLIDASRSNAAVLLRHPVKEELLRIAVRVDDGKATIERVRFRADTGPAITVAAVAPLVIPALPWAELAAPFQLEPWLTEELRARAGESALGAVTAAGLFCRLFRPATGGPRWGTLPADFRHPATRALELVRSGFSAELLEEARAGALRGAAQLLERFEALGSSIEAETARADAAHAELAASLARRRDDLACVSHILTATGRAGALPELLRAVDDEASACFPFLDALPIAGDARGEAIAAEDEEAWWAPLGAAR